MATRRDARAARPARSPGARARTQFSEKKSHTGRWPTVRRQNMDKHVKVCEGKAHTSNRGGGRWGDVARKTYFLTVVRVAAASEGITNSCSISRVKLCPVLLGCVSDSGPRIQVLLQSVPPVSVLLPAQPVTSHRQAVFPQVRFACIWVRRPNECCLGRRRRPSFFMQTCTRGQPVRPVSLSTPLSSIIHS